MKNIHSTHNQSKRKCMIITCAPSVRKLYEYSIRCHMPETYAILGGYLDNPFHITDFRSIPPKMSNDGRENAGSSYVQINKAYIDHFITHELAPAGKYMIGAWHSHPGNMNHLSRGRPGSGDGDISSMRGTLERAKAMGISWEYFLAPITTFNQDFTEDNITAWVITLSEINPILAELVFEQEATMSAILTRNETDKANIIQNIKQSICNIFKGSKPDKPSESQRKGLNIIV